MSTIKSVDVTQELQPRVLSCSCVNVLIRACFNLADGHKDAGGFTFGKLLSLTAPLVAFAGKRNHA